MENNATPEEEFDDEDAAYSLANWVPPWLDNGETLLGIIKLFQQGPTLVDERDRWMIFSVLLVHHLQHDITLAADLNRDITSLEKGLD